MTVTPSNFFLFIKFIGVILVNKIIQVSDVQFHNTSPIHSIAYSLKSLSITIFPHYTHIHLLSPSLPPTMTKLLSVPIKPSFLPHSLPSSLPPSLPSSLSFFLSLFFFLSIPPLPYLVFHSVTIVSLLSIYVCHYFACSFILFIRFYV